MKNLDLRYLYKKKKKLAKEHRQLIRDYLKSRKNELKWGQAILVRAPLEWWDLISSSEEKLKKIDQQIERLKNSESNTFKLAS